MPGALATLATTSNFRLARTGIEGGLLATQAITATFRRSTTAVQPATEGFGSEENGYAFISHLDFIEAAAARATFLGYEAAGEEGLPAGLLGEITTCVIGNPGQATEKIRV